MQLVELLVLLWGKNKMALSAAQIQSLQKVSELDPETAQTMLSRIAPPVTVPSTLAVPETELYAAGNSPSGVGVMPNNQPVLQPGLGGIGLNAGAELAGASPTVKAPGIPADGNSLAMQGMNNQISGYRGIGNVQAGLAKDEAEALRGIGIRMSTDSIKLEEIQAEKQRAVDDFAKTDSLAQKELAANMPGKDFWADATTGNKITAGIALFLSGVGSAITGKESQAMVVINSAIERDLKNQVLRYNALKDKRDISKDSFGIAQKFYGDKESALLGLQKQAYDRTLLQIKQYETLAKGTEAGEKAKIAIGMIQDQRADVMAKQTAQMVKVKEEKDKLSVPGLGPNAFAKTPENATKLREQDAAVQDASQTITRLKQIASIPGSSGDLTLRAEADALTATLVGPLKDRLIGAGAISESDWTRIEKAIPNPTDFGRRVESINTTYSTLNSKLKQSFLIRAKTEGIDVSSQWGSQATNAKPVNARPAF